MNILITGANGFLGKNLLAAIKTNPKIDFIYLFDVENTEEELELFCVSSDVIFHFAAIQRPKAGQSYAENVNLTERILDILERNGKRCAVVFSSSIQAELDNEYGECKRQEEKRLLSFGKTNGSHIFVFRFPNMFGAMSKPNYTSVVSTFSYNISHSLPVIVNDPCAELKLAYVNDVLDFVLQCLDEDKAYGDIIYYYGYTRITLGELVYLLSCIKNKRPSFLNNLDSAFVKKLEQVYRWFEEME